MKDETKVIRNVMSIREKWRKMVMRNPSLDPTHPSLQVAGVSAPTSAPVAGAETGEGDPA